MKKGCEWVVKAEGFETECGNSVNSDHLCSFCGKEIVLKKQSESCWFFHEWAKWVTYEQPIRRVSRGQTYETSETRQKRTCKKCGKTQDIIVY